jgi:hypothetical protein
MFTIAYDTELLRPGCVLVQVGLGATIPNEKLMLLDNWLTAPTDAMRILPLDDAMFEELVKINNER